MKPPTSRDLLPYISGSEQYQAIKEEENRLKRGDLLTAVIVLSIAAVILDPGLNSLLMQSPVGKVFRATTSAPKASSTATLSSEAVFPIKGKTFSTARITSGFGWRTHPLTGKPQHHNGIDLRGKKSDSVVATESGEITRVWEQEGSGGLIVELTPDSDKSKVIKYLHLNKQLVKRGQRVNAGDVIGELGSSGGSTGPHLDFRIQQNGKWINPTDYLKRLHQFPKLEETEQRKPPKQEQLSSSGANTNPHAVSPAKPKAKAKLIQPTKGTQTQGFHTYHGGIDWAAPLGTPIIAAQAGTVTLAGWDDWGLGLAVEIQHPDGAKTIYGHNSRLLVKKGQPVKQGQIIAEMGSTGNSTGPHLHFEYHLPGQGAVNPTPYLKPVSR